MRERRGKTLFVSSRPASVRCTGSDRQSPINNYGGVHLAVRGTNDVIRFDVAMDHTSTMDQG